MLLVAPFVGAWIEIRICMGYSANTASLRSSERGLKWYILLIRPRGGTVAPFVGAWIEILCESEDVLEDRSLRSSERGLK